MDDLDALAQRLQRLSDAAFIDFRIPDDPMPGLPAAVSSILGRAVTDAAQRPQSPERIAEAIAELRRGANDLSPRVLRYAVHGSCSRSEADGYCLLADQPTLDRLLDACERELHSDVRRFRRLYGGLLSSYFAAETGSSWFKISGAVVGHQRLRRFLGRHASFASALDPRTSWADALAQQPALLSEVPGASFAAEWVNGGQRAFTVVLEQLRLGGTSWLASDVVHSALNHATNRDDAGFTALIRRFLAAADEPRFSSIRDDIYAALLTRYTKCIQTTAHPELRDAVISAWRAPWLTKNHAAWGRVSDETRKMVEGWLKLELIHQFFDVLSDDRQQDRRRFEFWRQYHERMGAVYFALGSKAYRSRDADMIRLKSALDGRLLLLTDTMATNNAFIMSIDGKIFVEFSQKGNAALAFDRDELHIMDGQTDLSHHQLRRELVGERLLHHDRSGSGWEARFRDLLDARASPATLVRPAAPPFTSAPHIDHIIGYIRANGISIDDKRDQGGNLWILADQSNAALNECLTAWGFAPKSGRGWWRAD